ncbi:hypothetical protein GCM10022206_61480 [Streptomyces chiangmaiensis]
MTFSAGAELLGYRWAAGGRRFLSPFPADEAAVAGEQGAGGDRPAAAQRGGEVSGEGGEYGLVRPGQPWPGAEPAAQHGDFVVQRQQLDVLGSLGTGEQEEQPEGAGKGEIDDAEHHGDRACHDRRRASKAQVEAGTRVMAPYTVPGPVPDGAPERSRELCRPAPACGRGIRCGRRVSR